MGFEGGDDMEMGPSEPEEMAAFQPDEKEDSFKKEPEPDYDVSEEAPYLFWYKKNASTTSGKKTAILRFNYMVSAIVFASIMQACLYFGADAEAKKNVYTQNHRDYNVLVLWFLARIWCCISLFLLTMSFGSPRIRWWDITQRFVTIPIRMVLVAYSFYLLIGVLFMQIYPETYGLN
jgi:hypothetical protein